MELAIYQGHAVPDAKGICVVIDVLRAFTTAAFAFAAGAEEIIFVTSAEEAFKKREEDPTLILMGEEGGQMIPGFDFENSPSQFQTVNLTGRRLVQRTSSGTQGVIGCNHAPHILVSSFVIADATIKRINSLNPSHVSLIATGRSNGDEDLALADYLEGKLMGKPIDSEHLVNRVLLSPAALRMKQGPISYENGALDLELAVQIDRFPFAIEVFKENGELIGRKV